ncbi:MAG: alpha/beta hydrolase [Alkalinema sp. RL_2_19]|nr:alpha/beta hydrolase [Alkalinema sp. RL_2_19]
MNNQPIPPPAAPAVVETQSPGPAPRFGGTVQTYRWNAQGLTMRVVYEVIGQGQPMLLLPAFSSVCSRTEMGDLARELAAKYQVYVFDWIGFGDSDRPQIDYAPKVYRALLRTFVNTVIGEPPIVIAAGHTAGYVMQLAQETPQPWKWVVLVSPTWRGPLPTMMGGNDGEKRRNLFKWVQNLVGTPVLGQFLYWLNTTQGFLRWMYGRHVFANSENISPALVQLKQGLTRQKNGRFASVAFVTGALDPLRSRDDWVSLFQPIPVPVLMVIGAHMPPKSRQEAEVVAHFGGGVQVVRMPGSLGLHEEYPEMLAERILVSLDKFFGR